MHFPSYIMPGIFCIRVKSTKGLIVNESILNVLRPKEGLELGHISNIGKFINF